MISRPLPCEHDSGVAASALVLLRLRYIKQAARQLSRSSGGTDDNQTQCGGWAASSPHSEGAWLENALPARAPCTRSRALTSPAVDPLSHIGLCRACLRVQPCSAIVENSVCRRERCRMDRYTASCERALACDDLCRWWLETTAGCSSATHLDFSFGMQFSTLPTASSVSGLSATK